MEFVPQLREVIAHGREAGKGTAAAQLEAKLDQVLNSDPHKWFLGKTSAAELAARKRAAEQFKKRYAQ
jgi:hypothetical protein